MRSHFWLAGITEALAIRRVTARLHGNGQHLQSLAPLMAEWRASLAYAYALVSMIIRGRLFHRRYPWQPRCAATPHREWLRRVVERAVACLRRKRMHAKR